MFAREKYTKNQSLLDTLPLKEDLLSWSSEDHSSSLAAFQSTGLPTAAVEDWKFTNLKNLTDASFTAANDLSDAAKFEKALALVATLPAGPRLIFIDGCFSQDLSSDSADLPDGVTVTSASEASEEQREAVLNSLSSDTGITADDHPLMALNTAAATDGTLILFSAEVETPITLVFLYGQGNAYHQHHLRHVLVAESGASGRVVELHHGLKDSLYFANHVSTVQVAADANLERYKICEDSAEAFHISMTQTAIAKHGRYEEFVLNTGAKVSRQEVHAFINGTKAHCELNSAILLNDRRHADSTSRITHDAVNATSNQMCRSILDDQSRGVFQGRTVVARDAQQTDGYQLNKNLLLSRKAQIDTKPELEIYADDVKCSHGATTGELDSDALFYLRSRGINAKEARRLLVEAFLEENIDAISYDDLKPILSELVANWMAEEKHSDV